MNYQTKAMFYRQLAVMLNSGLPLVTALANLLAGMHTAGLRYAIQTLQAGVASGKTLSGLMVLAFGRNVTSLEIAVIKAGEVSGTLPESFRRLADYFALLSRTRSRLITGMVYPAILLHAAIIIPAVPILVLKGLLPFLRTVLPALTLIYGVAFVIVSLRRLVRTKSPVKTVWDGFVIRVPVFGKWIQTEAVLRFLQAFVCLYVSGVGILESVPLAAETMGNSVMEEEILKTIPLLKQGKTLTEAFSGVAYFPSMAYDMLSTGEVSGKLDETLNNVIAVVSHELEMLTERVITILPVVVYLMVAGYIAFIVISFYAGYFSQINSLL